MLTLKKRRAPSDQIEEQDAGGSARPAQVIQDMPVRLPQKRELVQGGDLAYGHHPRRPSVTDSLSMTPLHPNSGGGVSEGSSWRGVKRRHSGLRQDGDHSQQSSFRSRKRQRLDPGLQVPAPHLNSAPNTPVSSDPGAEIIIRGLPEDVTESEVKEAVAETFHREPYVDLGAPLFNFHVTLSRNPHQPKAAWVTFPYSNIVDAYFDQGDSVFLADEEPLRVAISHHPPDPQLVIKLRISRYETPKDMLARELLIKELAVRIPVQEMCFGVWTDAQVFSAEYAVQNATGPSVSDRPGTKFDSMDVWYDNDRRSVLVQCTGFPISSSVSPWKIASRTVVVFSVRDMSQVWHDRTQSCVLLHLRCPVVYENDSPEFLDKGPLFDGKSDRIRTFAFDQQHQRVARFTSNTILLRFSSPARFGEFLTSAQKIVRFPIPKERTLRIERCGVFETRWLYTLEKWYKSLPLSVALQCEQAIHKGAFTPFEMLLLKDSLQKALELGNEHVAAGTVQNLIQDVNARDALNSGPRARALHQLFETAAVYAVLEDNARKRWCSPDIAMCHQMYLTPTGFILEGPYQDRSNRVLRLYSEHHHHFMRVSFTEEGGQGRRLRRPLQTPVDWEHFVDMRVGNTLLNGFHLAGRHWEWLGYSQSALRDHQVLFMTPFKVDGEEVDAARIRKELGNFQKVYHQPAKYGARIAQAFTATSATIVIQEHEIQIVDDIERNGYCFTDGAGDMSQDMARDIWKAMRRRRGVVPSLSSPSAFQARFGGCKGVWMVNPLLQGRVIRNRPSQQKFDSKSRDFEVTTTSERPVPTYLNRPLVKLLEDLGVPMSAFLTIQDRAVRKVEKAQTSFLQAARLFRLNSLGTSFRATNLFTLLSEMLNVDFDSSPKEHIDFFRSSTMLSITHCLRDIKYRARIAVAGPTLIGVCDTWGLLKPGEIYVKVVEDKRRHPALQGKIVITRSPVIHPGDVQFATAVGEVLPTSPLSSLVNVVVFSSLGDRPLSSMLGGGDLDGDLFNVITEASLFPSNTFAAGSYKAVSPHVLDRPSTMADIAHFVVDYILGDLVGRISTLHLTIADQSEKGSLDPLCLELAEMASHAVDFTKSGVPVNRQSPPRPNSRLRPDFLSFPGDDFEKDTYPSNKALGHMFRAVPIQKYARPPEEHQNAVDASVLFKVLEKIRLRYPQLGLDPPRRAYVEKKWSTHMNVFCTQAEKIAYRNSLSLQDHLHLLEEELFIGTSGTAGKIDHGDMELLHRARTQTSEIVRTLRREIKDLKSEDEDSDDDDFDDEGEDGAIPNAVKQEDDIPDDHGGRSGARVKSEEDQKPLSTSPSGAEEEDEDDVVEIARPADVPGAAPFSPSYYDEEDEEVQEVQRPDKHLIAIRRAFNACHYALDVLSNSQKAPFGTRLFALVAMELLLSIIKTKTSKVESTLFKGRKV